MGSLEDDWVWSGGRREREWAGGQRSYEAKCGGVDELFAINFGAYNLLALFRENKFRKAQWSNTETPANQRAQKC